MNNFKTIYGRCVFSDLNFKKNVVHKMLEGLKKSPTQRETINKLNLHLGNIYIVNNSRFIVNKQIFMGKSDF